MLTIIHEWSDRLRTTALYLPSLVNNSFDSNIPPNVYFSPSFTAYNYYYYYYPRGDIATLLWFRPCIIIIGGGDGNNN